MSTDTQTGTRAVLRHARFSAYKAREVLDLIRGKSVIDAYSELVLCERGPAEPISKLLQSAVANAGHNDGLPAQELFVSTCFADEGPTMRRFRPRARGRATRIRKRTCHITIVVSRFSLEDLETQRERRGNAPADAATNRARRVARSRNVEESDADDTSAEVTDATIDADNAVETSSVTDTVASEAADGEATAAESADTGASEDDAPEADASEGDVDAADDAAEGDDAESDDSADSPNAAPQGLFDSSASTTEADDTHPYGEGSHAPLEDDSQPEGYPIKGNADSMLYHEPGGSHYGRTVAEVWFATAEDAERAGFTAPKSAARKED